VAILVLDIWAFPPDKTDKRREPGDRKNYQTTDKKRDARIYVRIIFINILTSLIQKLAQLSSS